MCLALGAPVASAGMIGNNVSVTTSATGDVTITPSGAGPAVVVDPGAEFTLCVGPGDGCGQAGLFTSVDFKDATIDFQFFGSTGGMTGGTFTLVFTGIQDSIVNVINLGGSLNGGTFDVSAFDTSSITFTGTTGGAFDGTNGPTISFAVTQAPEPASVFTAALGLFAVGLSRLRKR